MIPLRDDSHVHPFLTLSLLETQGLCRLQLGRFIVLVCENAFRDEAARWLYGKAPFPHAIHPLHTHTD
jgi:hypothetical protein